MDPLPPRSLRNMPPKLNAEVTEPIAKMSVVLAQSDRRDLWLKHRVPAEMLGLSVLVLSWGQIKAAIDRAKPISSR